VDKGVVCSRPGSFADVQSPERVVCTGKRVICAPAPKWVRGGLKGHLRVEVRLSRSVLSCSVSLVFWGFRRLVRVVFLREGRGSFSSCGGFGLWWAPLRASLWIRVS
jgi:hypothetical protein